MLKKLGLRKIAVTTSALFVIGLLYLFPGGTDIELNKKITYIEEEKFSPVYLIDSYNYVSQVDVVVNETELEKKLKEKLELITENKTKKDKIPKGFKTIIPENTKINSLEVEEDTVTIDFSKEFLSVSVSEEEKLIVAIIFTVTSEK